MMIALLIMFSMGLSCTAEPLDIETESYGPGIEPMGANEDKGPMVDPVGSNFNDRGPYIDPTG